MINQHIPRYTPSGVRWTCSCGEMSRAYANPRSARIAHTRHLQHRLKYEQQLMLDQHALTLVRDWAHPGGWTWECSCFRFGVVRGRFPQGRGVAAGHHAHHAKYAVIREVRNRLGAVGLI